MAAKRTNFEITSDGKLLCNEFREGDPTYTSSTDLPFYSSADYIACADALNEISNNKVIYHPYGKVLNCFEIIEGGLEDNTQKYVMGSATTLAELYQNFDPTWDIDIANSRITATNFDNFKTEVKRLGGDYNRCYIYVIEKRWKWSLYSSRAEWNNSRIVNVNGDIYNGTGYVIRAGAAAPIVSPNTNLSGNALANYNAQIDFEEYENSDISSLFNIIKNRYFGSSSWQNRCHVYFGIVYRSYNTTSEIGNVNIFERITRLPEQFIDVTFSYSNRSYSNISVVKEVNPIFI